MAFGNTSDQNTQPAASQASAQPAFTPRPMVNQPGANQPLVRTLDPQTGKRKPMSRNSVSRMAVGAVLVVMIVLGTGVGFAANRFIPTGATSSTQAAMDQVQQTTEITDSQVKNGAIFGVPDEGTFKDPTEGVLIKGGIGNEGTHTILREGGASQNVYLTSSVIDLDQFEGMDVKVWGETNKGQKAGWLMDVGRLEVVNTTATKPSWYQAK